MAGFIGAIPVYFGTQTPARIKVALVFAISLVLFPVLVSSLPAVSFSPIPFLLLTINETLLGLLLGLMARLIFTAVEFGATVIGYQMGFAAANVFDPQSRTTDLPDLPVPECLCHPHLSGPRRPSYLPQDRRPLL